MVGGPDRHQPDLRRYPWPGGNRWAAERAWPRPIPRRWEDPFRAVLDLGQRQARRGIVFGLAGALFLHGGATARAFASLVDIAGFTLSIQKQIAERLRTTYDVEVEPPPPPPPEPKADPMPEPEPQPTKLAPAPHDAPPEPPAAAQAGKVLTAEPDPNEPVDLTDQGFVSGDGERYVGGTTAAKGTSTTAVHNSAATASGVPGGRGAAPAPAKDLSRPAMPKSLNWNCGFPAEADMEQVDSAVVRIVVTVSPDGRAKSVQVMKDPGFGFGALARQCAFRNAYVPGFDALGSTVTKTTPPFAVRFSR
jgi:periplasmic protein TonB